MPQPRLKRVEIQGFKTFASRAEFDLPEGIVAFVGPNGSGKSNLVDAIRWGMGEQNPRLIRCRRSEDVVFGGGASLPPAGMAEVTLLFDNCDHWLDLEYEEVQIARRAYRSGENEYLLNGRKVRLKDIQGLFARAGLTESGSIVVGQGMIDSVLSLRPDRRRAFFEDIAGLAHCRARLTQARVELGRTNDNLSRVADLLAEIKPRLEPLSRRAGAVLRYREIADQLYEMLGRLFASRLAKLSTKLRSNKDKFTELDANIAEQESEYRQLETNIQEFLAAEMTAERELSDLRGDISRQRATLVEADRTAAILTERRSATKEQLNSLARDLDRTLERIANLSKEQDGAQAQLDSANNEVAELNQRLKSLDRNLSKTSLRRVQLESQRRESSERQAQSDRELIQLETRRAGLDSRRESLLQRHGRTKQQLSGCEERLRGSEAAQRALAGQRSEIERAETALSESIRSTRTKREQTIGNVGNARKHCSETRNRFNALQSQMTALNHSRESGESLYMGVKSVLSAAKNGRLPARLRGIVGVVASLIEAPAELETALEVALGAHLQDIVVERWKDAEAGVGYLKQAGLGRATFLPLDTLRVTNGRHPAGGAGVMGVASTLVRCDRRFAIVADYLLGHTMVVSDMPTARELVARCPRGWQIVTVGGELVRSTGAVTGGSMNRRNGGLLERERKARELPSSLTLAKSDLAAHELELAELETELAKLDQELGETSRQRQDISSQLTKIQRECDRVFDGLERANREKSDYLADLARDETDIAELDELRRQLDKKIDAARENVDQGTSKLSTLHSEVLAERDRIEPLQASRDSCAVALTATRERTQLATSRIKATTSIIAQEEQAASDCATHLSQRRNLLTDVDGQLEATNTRRIEASDKLELSELAAEESEAKLSSIAGSYRIARERVQLLGAELGRSRELRAELRSEISAASASIESLLAQATSEMESDDVQPAQDTHSLVVLKADKQQVFEPAAEDEEARLKKSAGALRRRLRSFGPIDASAPAEYESERQRIEELESEANQIGDAASKLGRSVREMESTMVHRFDEAVATINKAFARHFSLLFGGGVARIEIAGDDEGAGLEIVARPPGKRTESLTALSGGERALAASALFFAILETSPTPFCVLDEVDAAFDDANIGRFCRILREFSERIQFLVITHNKRTMEAASALYGLAIVDKAVSKVVSVRLVEPAAGRAQAKAS